MTTKPVSPILRDILQETEKENIRQTGVILHTRVADKRCWDDDLDDAPTDQKRSRTNCVSNLDPVPLRRRPKPKMKLPVLFTPAEDIARRNERERNRVRTLNESFEELRECIPIDDEGKKKKLSKVEVLRLAVNYIQNLEGMLDLPGMSSDDGENSIRTADIKNEKDFESESDVLDLSSDNHSRDNDHLDRLDIEDSVDKSVEQFYDETSLPPISQSFPGQGLSVNYPEMYVVFGVGPLKV